MSIVFGWSFNLDMRTGPICVCIVRKPLLTLDNPLKTALSSAERCEGSIRRGIIGRISSRHVFETPQTTLQTSLRDDKERKNLQIGKITLRASLFIKRADIALHAAKGRQLRQF